LKAPGRKWGEIGILSGRVLPGISLLAIIGNDLPRGWEWRHRDPVLKLPRGGNGLSLEEARGDVKRQLSIVHK